MINRTPWTQPEEKAEWRNIFQELRQELTICRKNLSRDKMKIFSDIKGWWINHQHCDTLQDVLQAGGKRCHMKCGATEEWKALETTTKVHKNYLNLKSMTVYGTSLVAQWLRICLPMQGTQVLSLLQEGSTCHAATKPACHDHWAHAPGSRVATPEPVCHNSWSSSALEPCAVTTEPRIL